MKKYALFAVLALTLAHCGAPAVVGISASTSVGHLLVLRNTGFVPGITGAHTVYYCNGKDKVCSPVEEKYQSKESEERAKKKYVVLLPHNDSTNQNFSYVRQDSIGGWVLGGKQQFFSCEIQGTHAICTEAKMEEAKSTPAGAPPA